MDLKEKQRISLRKAQDLNPKKGARRAGEYKSVTLTLITTLNFWCSDRDFNSIHFIVKLTQCNIFPPKKQPAQWSSRK